MRRALVFGTLVGGWLALSATGALATDGIDEYLNRASDSEFSGRQVVSCSVDNDGSTGTYDVVQVAGTTMIHAGPLGAMFAGGRMGDDRGWSPQLIDQWADWRISERYSLAEPEDSSFLGRDAIELRILEGDRTRTRVLLDEETSAPLFSEVYDGDGDVFCMAAMLEFDTEGDMPTFPEPAGGYETVETGGKTRLPEAAFGYWRADTYLAGGGMVQAFYTDGLFSFSVFEAKATAKAGDLEKADKVELASKTYRRIVLPGETRLLWRTASNTYILLGDLPPDHLETVLVELPRPARANVMVRVWRSLFG